jgi:hypothetical protein
MHPAGTIIILTPEINISITIFDEIGIIESVQAVEVDIFKVNPVIDRNACMGADPEITFMIFKNAGDQVVRQSVPVCINFEIFTVEPAEAAAIGPCPYQATAILENNLYLGLR